MNFFNYLCCSLFIIRSKMEYNTSYVYSTYKWVLEGCKNLKYSKVNIDISEFKNVFTDIEVAFDNSYEYYRVKRVSGKYSYISIYKDGYGATQTIFYLNY